MVHGEDSAYPNVATVYALFDMKNDDRKSSKANMEDNHKSNTQKTILKRGIIISFHYDCKSRINSLCIHFYFIQVPVFTLHKISANTEFNNSRLLREQMIGILNRRDNYGNTPLHYAKPYPNQNIVKLLLSFGAKLDLNQQGEYLEYTNIVLI